jgi:hypothetical protein
MSEFLKRLHAVYAEFPAEAKEYEAEFAQLQAVCAAAYDWLKINADHKYDCPRSRDDYDCKCGLSDVMYDIEQILNIPGSST